MLRLGHQEDRFDARVELAVHAHHLELVLEVRDRAQAAQDHLRAHVARGGHEQVLERMGHELDAGLVPERGELRLDHRHPLLQRKERALVAVDRHPDHQAIHQRGGAPDDVEMAQGDGVERPRIKPDPHGALPAIRQHHRPVARKAGGAARF